MAVSRASLLLVLVPLLLALAPETAQADDKQACVAASSAAQTMRDAHHLIEARDQLRLCAQPTCPAAIRKDCLPWLSAVEGAIPTVVASLKDGAGNDVLDANVMVDGKPFLASLTGDAVPIDPGAHMFHFERKDGASVDKQVLVGEGQQNLAVVGVLPAPPSFAPPPPLVSPPAPSSESSPLHTAGWIVGGVGVAGLIVGAVFGGLAVSDKSSANCTNDKCTNFGSVGDAKTAADVSDVGLIAGGVLAATGAALVLFAPAHRATQAGGLAVTPMVGAAGEGLLLRGEF
jgi:hypothetical protein